VSLGKNRYIISMVNYEGGLTGLVNKTSEIAETKDFKTDFSFKASDNSLNCVSGSGHLLAVGGSSEIVQLYNLRTKLECGDLYGHTGSVTSTAVSPNGQHVLSASEDGTIIIWRTADCMALHELKVMNVQKIISLSIHNSGRMLLALYANGMLRLWNLLDARCTNKRMVGLSGEYDSEDEDEDEEERQLRLEKKNL
jgi:protein MAK11